MLPGGPVARQEASAPEGGLYQLVDGQVTLRIGARSQLRVGHRFGAIGMYWDFGDEPPGLYCKRGHGDAVMLCTASSTQSMENSSRRRRK